MTTSQEVILQNRQYRIPETAMYPSRHLPQVIAHRGFCRQHIENTIPALMAAKAVKAEMIEMDVHETRDGHFVVHHDNSLYHNTPPFRYLTCGQIQSLTGRDGRAPLLLDCLKAMGSMPVDLEIKSCLNVANLCRELETSPPSPGSYISSFDFSLLKRLNTKRMGLPLLLLVTISMRQTLVQNIRSAAFCAVPWLLPDFLDGMALDHRMAHRTCVRNLQQNSRKVVVWTVNERDQMEKFISWGVDGIITDRPDLLLKLRTDLQADNDP